MEEWRAVPGQTQFLVSSEGRVARLMKVDPPSRRYVRINVRDALGKMRGHLAHVWVLEAFRGPRPVGAVARHLNDDPVDNRLENLAWGTFAQNTEDAFTNGGRTLKELCPLGHLIAGANLQVKGRRCKACNQARANAHWHGREFDPELAHARYERLINA
jgi:hypothetical protein